MIIEDIDKYVAIGKEIIAYSSKNIQIDYDLKIRYKIDKENKEIRLYDVPRVLTFQEKSAIYYAILDRFFFFPLSMLNKDFKDENIENYIVRENGYTYHEFNNIEGKSKGILGELLFEIPRQEIETEKLKRIRDIYEMLIRNVNELGKNPICIAFNGLTADFKDVFKCIKYMLKEDDKLKVNENKCILLMKKGLFGRNKRIFILPIKDLVKEASEE